MIDLEADKNVTLQQIRDKYYECDLTGVSDEELIKNEKISQRIGGRTSYPYKPRHDPFTTTGRYAKWSNPDGDRITMDISGSLGDSVNIFDG